MKNNTNNVQSTTNGTSDANPSFKDRKKAAKEILTDRVPNLSTESALEFIDEDELRHLLYSLSDILEVLAFPQSVNEKKARQALQGAVLLESYVIGEVERRMEKQGFDESLGANLK